MRRFTPVLLLALVALAGCSAAVPPEPTPTRVDERSTPTPTPSPTPTGPTYLSELNASIPLTDVDGYTFTVDIDHRVVSAAVDPSGDKPGETSVQLELADEYTITNTTPGRDVLFPAARGMTSPLNQAQFNLWAGWPMDSVICQNGKGVIQGQPISTEGGGHCAIMLSFGRISTDLAAGETRELEWYRGAPNGAGDAGLAQMPELEGPSIREQLVEPPIYVVTFNGVDATTRFASACSEGFGNGYRAVWASETCAGVTPIRAKGHPQF